MRATHRTILAAVGSPALVATACDVGTDGMTPSPTNQPLPTTPGATASPPDDGSPSPEHAEDRAYALSFSDAATGVVEIDSTAIARRSAGGGGDETIELEITEDGATLGSWTTRSTSALPAEPDHLAFSDDGEQLAFSVRFEDGTGVYVLDLTSTPTGGELTEAVRQVEPREEDGWMSFRPFWLGDGTFGLVQGFGDLTGFERYEAVTVDLGPDEITGALFEVPRAVGEIDRGAEGDRLIFSLRHVAHGGDGAQPPVVMSWSGDEPRQIATDLTSPTW